MIRFDYKEKLFIQVLFEQLKDAGLEVNLDIQPNGACIHLIDKSCLPPVERNLVIVDDYGIELITKFRSYQYYDFNEKTLDEIVEHAKEWL